MIDVTLVNPSAEYRPGEMITGSLAWSDLDPKTTQIRAQLYWFTEGKGSRDYTVFATIAKDISTPSGSTKFEFQAPSRPLSFSGKLISLCWAIEFKEMPSGPAEETSLTISHDGKEIQLENTFEQATPAFSMT